MSFQQIFFIVEVILLYHHILQSPSIKTPPCGTKQRLQWQNTLWSHVKHWRVFSLHLSNMKNLGKTVVVTPRGSFLAWFKLKPTTGTLMCCGENFYLHLNPLSKGLCRHFIPLSWCCHHTPPQKPSFIPSRSANTSAELEFWTRTRVGPPGAPMVHAEMTHHGLKSHGYCMFGRTRFAEPIHIVTDEWKLREKSHREQRHTNITQTVSKVENSLFHCCSLGVLQGSLAWHTAL